MSGTNFFGYNSLDHEIISLVNKANTATSTNFKEGDLAFEQISYNTGSGLTSCEVRSKVPQYFAKSYIEYTKRQWSYVFHDPIDVMVLPGTKVSEVLATIAARYSLNPFTATDFASGVFDQAVDFTQVPEGSYWYLASIPFDDMSMEWRGTAKIRIFDKSKDLGYIIATHALDGLHYPDNMTGRQTPAYTLTFPMFLDSVSATVKLLVTNQAITDEQARILSEAIVAHLAEDQSLVGPAYTPDEIVKLKADWKALLVNKTPTKMPDRDGVVGVMVDIDESDVYEGKAFIQCHSTDPVPPTVVKI